MTSPGTAGRAAAAGADDTAALAAGAAEGADVGADVGAAALRLDAITRVI